MKLGTNHEKGKDIKKVGWKSEEIHVTWKGK